MKEFIARLCCYECITTDQEEFDNAKDGDDDTICVSRKEQRGNNRGRK